MCQGTAGQAKTLELSPPEKLGSHHVTEHFDCGEASIDDYLQNKALKAQEAKHAMVSVCPFQFTRMT